jgi:hypothetical protein
MTQYHVTLNSQGYLLDLDRYTRRIREPFVPRRGQGSVVVGDLRGPEQVLVISDWSGGEGYVQHDEASSGRFRSGSGIDGYSVPGTLRLGPYASLVGTTTADQVRSIEGYGSKVYFGCAGGLIYSWDGTTFANPHTVPGSVVMFALETFLNKLYGGNASNGNLLSFDGTTWTDVTATAGGAIRCLLTHYREAAQYLYLGSLGAGSGGIGRIYYWDGGVLSAGQFDPEEPTPQAAFVLGERAYFVFASSASRVWAIYSVDDSGLGGIWQRHVVVPGYGTPIAATVWRGKAYIGDAIGGRLYSFDGTDLELEFQLGTPTTPFPGFLPVHAWGDALWLGVLDGGAVSLLRYDGRTRYRAVTGLTGSDARVVGSFGDVLYLGTAQTGASKVYKVDPTLFGGSGTLTSGLISFGLPGISKLLRSVTLVTAAMPSGQSVQVEYQLEDTGAWTSLGTFSTVGGTSVTYSFPSNATCRQLSLRVTLTGSAGSASSPVVHEVAVRYVPRPAITREWELSVILEGTPELPLVTLDGTPDPLTGAQLTSALWTAAAAAGPVTLVDLDGTSYGVYVADIREEIGKVSQRTGYQRLGRVTLIEAA